MRVPRQRARLGAEQLEGADSAQLDEITLLRDVRVAEEQIARGEGIPHEDVVARLRKRLIK